MERLSTNQIYSSGVPVTVPTSMPCIQASLDESFPILPIVQNAMMERELRSAPLPTLQANVSPIRGQFHSSTGSVGPLCSPPVVRFSSVSNPEQYSTSNPYNSQAQSTSSSSSLNYGSQYGSFEPSLTDFPRDVEPIWCPDPIDCMLGYSSDVLGGNNSIAASDDLIKQSEWWTYFMNDDWKEIVDNPVSTENQKVCQSYADSHRRFRRLVFHGKDLQAKHFIESAFFSTLSIPYYTLTRRMFSTGYPFSHFVVQHLYHS
jgi:hypothetical protein